MAFTRVKLSSAGSASTCTFTGGNTVGNFIIVCWLTNGAIATTCNDTFGNAYTRVAVNSGSNKLAVFYAPVTVGGSSTNTLSVSGGGTGFGTEAIEYSGKVASSYLDPSSSEPTTGGSATSVTFSLTPAVSGELMFGVVNYSGGGTSWTMSGTSGFALQFNTGQFIAVFDNLNCGSGNQAPIATASGPGATIQGVMVGIKPGSTGIPNSFMLMGVGT